MRRFLLLALLPLLIGCRAATTATQDDLQAAFITLLGEDTLAVERFQHTDDGMIADVVLRAPRTTVRRYEIILNEDGGFERYEATIRNPDDDAVLRQETVSASDGGLLVAVTAEGETRESTIEGGRDALPFIDMVHWPFELALRRTLETGQDSVIQPLFTARGVTPFVIRNHGDRRMSIEHPFRGTMDVDVDSEGRLERLDAARTTRAVTVERVADVDVDGVAARFAAEDAAGRSFGALSGRGETVATVAGANISVDFGQPSKRGREIWGRLVPWGQVWRTGANRATHIETDRTLQFEGLEVPAGTYTLFSIPEANGGVLIISGETGQNGNSYDPAHDLGRVPMQAERLDEAVEDFTVDVVEVDGAGELRLEWDRTAMVVPFRVR